MRGDPHGDLRVEANLIAYREAAALCLEAELLGSIAGPCTITGCHVCTGQIRDRYLKGGDSARM